MEAATKLSTKERWEKTLDLKRVLAGLTMAMEAIEIKRDEIKHELRELDPYCAQVQKHTVSTCRNCDQPICSEHDWSCPSCNDSNPFDYDYGDY